MACEENTNAPPPKQKTWSSGSSAVSLIDPSVRGVSLSSI